MGSVSSLSGGRGGARARRRLRCALGSCSGAPRVELNEKQAEATRAEADVARGTAERTEEGLADDHHGIGSRDEATGATGEPAGGVRDDPRDSVAPPASDQDDVRRDRGVDPNRDR